MYVLSYCTIKDKQRNIISFLSSSRKTATWQFTNRPLLIKLYRVIVFVQISMKFFFPWKAFLMYYNPSNKFFTHLYHNSRHNCLKKCSVFFCAMVKKLFGLGLGVGRRIETEAAQSRLLGAARVRLAGSGGVHFGSADRSCYEEEPREISVRLVQRFGSYKPPWTS